MQGMVRCRPVFFEQGIQGHRLLDAEHGRVHISGTPDNKQQHRQRGEDCLDQGCVRQPPADFRYSFKLLGQRC
ncbi:hypothetical protein D3C74_414720 [compost metagenome]